MPAPQQLLSAAEAYEQFAAHIDEAKKMLADSTFKLEKDLATKKIQELLALLKSS